MGREGEGDGELRVFGKCGYVCICLAMTCNGIKVRRGHTFWWVSLLDRLDLAVQSLSLPLSPSPSPYIYAHTPCWPRLSIHFSSCAYVKLITATETETCAINLSAKRFNIYLRFEQNVSQSRTWLNWVRKGPTKHNGRKSCKVHWRQFLFTAKIKVNLF